MKNSILLKEILNWLNSDIFLNKTFCEKFWSLKANPTQFM